MNLATLTALSTLCVSLLCPTAMAQQKQTPPIVLMQAIDHDLVAEVRADGDYLGVLVLAFEADEAKLLPGLPPLLLHGIVAAYGLSVAGQLTFMLPTKGLHSVLVHGQALLFGSELRATPSTELVIP